MQFRSPLHLHTSQLKLSMSLPFWLEVSRGGWISIQPRPKQLLMRLFLKLGRILQMLAPDTVSVRNKTRLIRFVRLSTSNWKKTRLVMTSVKDSAWWGCCNPTKTIENVRIIFIFFVTQNKLIKFWAEINQIFSA